MGDSDWLRLSDGLILGWGLPGIWAGTLLDNGFRWFFLKRSIIGNGRNKTMTRAFIWDLDGTLLDSYEAILDGIAETYAYYSLDFDREAVHAFILQQSVQSLLEDVAREHGLDAEEMNRYRASSLREKNAQVHLMQGARDILTWGKEEGIAQFVYTHKGKNAYPILEDLGILSYFQEIVTTDNGFRRKPDPEGSRLSSG